MKKTTCRHCGAIDSHYSFNCYKRSKTPTPIGDYTMTKKPTPIPKVSSKEKKRQVAYNALRKEFMKQFPVCQFKECKRPSEHAHHIRGRIGEMLLDTTEWMAVCAEHHLYIHENDKECRELGYLKSRLGK